MKLHLRPFHFLWLAVLTAAASTGTLAYRFAESRRSKQAHAPQLNVRFLATTHDFGDVATGCQLKTTFTLVNAGTVPIHIRKVQGSCGCIATASQKGSIAPGATTVVSVELSTVGAPAPLKLDKSITVLFEEKGLCPAQLEVLANLLPDVEVKPDHLHFSDDETRRSSTIQVCRRMLGESEFREVRIAVADDSYYQVTEMNRSLDLLTYRVGLVGRPAGSRLPPLIVRHLGQQAKDLKTVFCEYQGAVVIPTAYVFVIGNAAAADLPRLSKQRFSVPTNGNGVTFASLSLDSPSDAALFSSDLPDSRRDPGHGAKTFAIWLKRAPSERILKTFATIHYFTRNESVEQKSRLAISVIRAQ